MWRFLNMVPNKFRRVSLRRVFMYLDRWLKSSIALNPKEKPNYCIFIRIQKEYEGCCEQKINDSQVHRVIHSPNPPNTTPRCVWKIQRLIYYLPRFRGWVSSMSYDYYIIHIPSFSLAWMNTTLVLWGDGDFFLLLSLSCSSVEKNGTAPLAPGIHP